MGEPSAWPTISREPARRGRSWLRWALGGAAVVVVFALGVAFGQSLDDNPDAEGAETRTLVRTLQPRPLSLPPPRTTVTVSVPDG